MLKTLTILMLVSMPAAGLAQERAGASAMKSTAGSLASAADREARYLGATLAQMKPTALRPLKGGPVLKGAVIGFVIGAGLGAAASCGSDNPEERSCSYLLPYGLIGAGIGALIGWAR